MTYDGQAGVFSVGTKETKTNNFREKKLDFWMFFSMENTSIDAPSRGKSQNRSL